MCAILDVNRAHQLLPDSPTESVDPLTKWVERGHGKLVVGGALLDELGKNLRVAQWIAEQHRSGGVVSLTPRDRQEVSTRTVELRNHGVCKSNDEHIIALAQIKRVRLILTADKNLQEDFKNRKLIDNPRGKVYPYRANSSDKKKFLDRVESCPSGC